ncbi:MAG: CofH family radical SAM protein [Fibrobacter sp.]|nr:CofH family radical SAM protein [Fibrobacter sp.]
MHPLLQKSLSFERLSPKEALLLLKEADWTEVVQAANAVRNAKLPGKRVGYTVYRIINYTNICSVNCSFCSFARKAGDRGTYVLSLEQIRRKAEDAKKLGADQIFLQGGVNEDLPIEYYTEVLQMLTQDLGMSVRGFSPVELVRIANAHKLSLVSLLQILKEAGLSSVPGAGAEILSDPIRKELSPRKLSAKEWRDTLAVCQKNGLPGSANIVIGTKETPEDIIAHLELVRGLQDETGGVKSFVAWTFQPQTHDFPIRHVTPMEYLKVLGLSRLYLDNIRHIEVSVLGMGKQVGELGLSAGADDINSIVLEENVLESHGIRGIAEAESFIRGAGFIPYRRDLNFSCDL